MIDGIRISKQLPNDKINYSSLEHISSGQYGDRYRLKVYSNAKYNGNSPIVTITSRDKLIIKGSLPYLINDNNIVPFSKDEIKGAFEDLSNRLGIELNEAIVNNFEFGVTVIVPFSFKEFIHHHRDLSKMDSSAYGNKGKYFQNKNIRIKLYDASRNAKYKLSRPVRQNLSKSGKYDEKSNYVKFEIQYKNPIKRFGQVITVGDLIDPDFLWVCGEELLDTYRKIRKTGFTIPKTAKELTTPKILAIALKEMEQLADCDAEKLVEEKIKILGLLKNWQKYDRRKSIKKAFRNLTLGSESPYDISNLLEEAIIKYLQEGRTVDT